jgi:hypothetical protein
MVDYNDTKSKCTLRINMNYQIRKFNITVPVRHLGIEMNSLRGYFDIMNDDNSINYTFLIHYSNKYDYYYINAYDSSFINELISNNICIIDQNKSTLGYNIRLVLCPYVLLELI